mgnify:CR=1 FL=1
MKIKSYWDKVVEVTGKTQDALDTGELRGIDAKEWPYYLYREYGNNAVEFYGQNWKEVEPEYITIKIKAEDWARMDTEDGEIYTIDTDQGYIVVDYIKVVTPCEQ